jgi:hypothetical protein
VLFYLDQSGFYHPNDPNVFFVTAAIAFQKDVLKELARSLFKLNEVYWKKSDPYDFELKGQLLLNPRAIKHPKNIDYTNEVLRICRQQSGVIFAIIEPRPNQESFEALNQLLLPKSFKYLFERINKYCICVNSDEKGIMIFDSQDMRKNEVLSRKISNFFYRSRAALDINNIIPEPYFVSSNICYGIQLADLAAYIVAQKFSGRNELIPFYNQIRDLQFKSIDEDTEYQLNGIKLIKNEPTPEEP